MPLKFSLKEQRIGNLCTEAGFADLIPLTLVLPIAIMLFAAVVDFTRVPIAEERLVTALQIAAYGIEAKMGASSSPYTIDSYAPAGNLLCDFMKNCADIDSLEGRNSLFTPDVSSEFVKVGCELAGENFSNLETNFLSGSSSHSEYAMHFVLFRADIGSSGTVDDVVAVAESSDSCATGGVAISTFGTGGFFDADAINASFENELQQFAAGSGAWPMLNDDGINGTYETGAPPYLSSWWLLAVGVVKVDRLITNLFGDSKTVVRYFIRPLNNPAAIQDGAL